MIDHVSIVVTDLKSSTAFYEPLLATLGLKILANRETTVGFGKRYPEFWINVRPTAKNETLPGAHICLRARDVETVKAFHAAAIAGGGTSENEPGFWPQYSAGYFAAFVQDPDGNRIEAAHFVAQA